MNHYLYAIVDRMPTAWRPPTGGLGEASVVPRRVHDVVVLGSLLDTIPPATPRTPTPSVSARPPLPPFALAPPASHPPLGAPGAVHGPSAHRYQEGYHRGGGPTTRAIRSSR